MVGRRAQKLHESIKVLDKTLCSPNNTSPAVAGSAKIASPSAFFFLYLKVLDRITLVNFLHCADVPNYIYTAHSNWNALKPKLPRPIPKLLYKLSSRALPLRQL